MNIFTFYINAKKKTGTSKGYFFLKDYYLNVIKYEMTWKKHFSIQSTFVCVCVWVCLRANIHSHALYLVLKIRGYYWSLPKWVSVGTVKWYNERSTVPRTSQCQVLIISMYLPLGDQLIFHLHNWQHSVELTSYLEWIQDLSSLIMASP